MNESKQEPEVPSKETSGKEVGESYILCSSLPRLVFASKQSLHRKLFLVKNSGSTLSRTSFGLGNPKSCTVFLTPQRWKEIVFFLSKFERFKREERVKVNLQANDATMALINCAINEISKHNYARRDTVTSTRK